MTGSLITFPSGRQLFVEKYDPSETTRRDATPIIFIHGIFGSTNTFRSVLSAFPNRTRILYDLVGHAQSPLSKTFPTIQSLTQDVEEILEHFGLNNRKLDIVAHSGGTVIGIEYGLKNPERVRKLVLLGPTRIPMSNEMKKLVRIRAESMRKYGLEGTILFIVESGLGENAKQNPLMTAELEEEVLRHDKEGVARIVDAMTTFDCDGKQDSWRVDTTIIAGTEDAMSSVKDCTKTAEWTKGKIVTLNTGHQFTIEDPEGVRKLLKSVLDEVQ